MALAVMLGHDFVSHAHEEVLVDHNISVFQPAEHNLTGLEHAFAHLKHTSVERQINYAGSLAIKSDLKIKYTFAIPRVTSSDVGILWYANLKKHPFWNLGIVPAGNAIVSFSLRGPPSC